MSFIHTQPRTRLCTLCMYHTLLVNITSVFMHASTMSNKRNKVCHHHAILKQHHSPSICMTYVPL